MSDFINNVVQPYFNFWVYVILLMMGLWALIAKNNLIKKLIGLSIFQTAIILFYVSAGVKEDSTIPILLSQSPAEAIDPSIEEPLPESGYHSPEVPVAAKVDTKNINPDQFANPLPHVLMLTAIVVGVATLGVALAISQMVFKQFGTLEENEILKQMKGPAEDG
ncbi:MAG: cation:proton antiporter subunit C [Verrucomicrobiota bacterium]